MLTSLYWLTQSLADVPEQDDWLTSAERACLAKLRFSKRRAEWKLGRWTAKCVLAEYFRQAKSDLRTTHVLNLDTPDAQVGLYWVANQIEILAAADGAPEAFVQNQPVPITLSISHRDDIGFCVINPCNLAIGCDLEKVEPRSSNFVDDYFTPDEKELTARTPEKDRPWFATLIWSAKESTLKALRQGLRLDTRSVVVDVVNKTKAIPTDRNNATDKQIFYPLRCFYPLGKSEWNLLTVRYTETAQTFHGWWRLVAQASPAAAGPPNQYIQTIIIG